MSTWKKNIVQIVWWNFWLFSLFSNELRLMTRIFCVWKTEIAKTRRKLFTKLLRVNACIPNLQVDPDLTFSDLFFLQRMQLTSDPVMMMLWYQHLGYHLAREYRISSRLEYWDMIRCHRTCGLPCKHLVSKSEARCAL